MSRRPRVIAGPPSQSTFAYQRPDAAASASSPSYPGAPVEEWGRTAPDSGQPLPDPLDGLSDDELERRFEVLANRLNERVQAVAFRSDVGGHAGAGMHDALGESIYADWLERNKKQQQQLSPAAAAVTAVAERQIDVEIFLRNVLWYHVIENAFTTLDRQSREREEAYEAAVAALADSEAAAREARRAAAAAEELHRREERRERHFSSADPMIADIRKAAAARIAEQDAARIAAEEDEIRRLEERLAAKLAPTLPADDDECRRGDGAIAAEPVLGDDLGCARHVRFAPANPTGVDAGVHEDHDIVDDDPEEVIQQRRHELQVMRNRVAERCIDTASLHYTASTAGAGRSRNLQVQPEGKVDAASPSATRASPPPSSSTATPMASDASCSAAGAVTPSSCDTGELIRFGGQPTLWRQRAAAKAQQAAVQPQAQRYDFISTPTID